MCAPTGSAQQCLSAPLAAYRPVEERPFKSLP